MELIGKFIVMLSLIIIVTVFLALPTMLIWNWLMPVVFGLIKINFWQALSINILTGILFRSSHTNSDKD